MNSVRKEVKDIFKITALHLVNFCIRTFRASHSGEMLILNIKNFCPETPSGPELIFVVLLVFAFGAMIF